MHRVDAKLAEWTKAYERLKEAQARYKDKGPLVTPETSAQLRDEMDRLQREAEAAFRELQAEFDEAKRRMASPSSSRAQE